MVPVIWPSSKLAAKIALLKPQTHDRYQSASEISFHNWSLNVSAEFNSTVLQSTLAKEYVLLSVRTVVEFVLVSD